jgi:hypothetical protein
MAKTPGSYVPPFGGLVTLQAFLDAIRELKPVVLEELRDEILPRWTEFSDPVAVTFSILTFVFGPEVEGDEDRARCDRAIEAVADPIWQWAAKYSLVRSRADYRVTMESKGEQCYCLNLFGVIRGTLAHWAGSAEKSAEMKWGEPAPLEGLLPFDPGESIATNGSVLVPVIWNPFGESRADARKRIMVQVQEMVDGVLDEIETEIREIGAKPLMIDPVQDFKCLVMHQVMGMSADQIKNQLLRGMTRQAVEAAYKRAAKSLVGSAWRVWLRRQKRGPKPK